MATVVNTNLKGAQKRVSFTFFRSPVKLNAATLVGPITLSGVTIARSGNTATATKAAHGYVNGDSITIAGATQTDYNITAIISNVTTNTFDYTVANTPTTPATGAPTSTKTFTRVVSSITIAGETATITSTGHGFANATSVTIAGVVGTGQSSLNGAKSVTNTAANTFDIAIAAIDTSAELLTAIESAILSDVVKVVSVKKIATTTYEVTTQKPHTNVTAESVTIAGTTNFNGAKTITSVPTPTTWRFTHINSTDADETAPVSATATFTAASVFDAAAGSNAKAYLLTKPGVTATPATITIDLGGSAVANQPTGLVSGTTYTATVTITGAANNLSFLGSTAQTFTTLLSQINAGLTGATATLVNGNIVITTTATDETRSLTITADALFKFLPPMMFRGILAPVAGASGKRYIKIDTNTAGQVKVSVFKNFNSGTHVGTQEVLGERRTVNLAANGAAQLLTITTMRDPNQTRDIVIV